MKSPHKILLAAIVLTAFSLVACAQDATKTVYWYSFDIEHHNEIAATSSLTPEQLAKALSGTEFIRLDTVREFNGATKWIISKAPFTDTLYVRPATVKSFSLLTGPPTDPDKDTH